MTQITPQPYQILLQKLCLLKCTTPCPNPANYLIFSQGLFCTQCVSKQPEHTILITLDKLSHILVKLIQNYRKTTKSEIGYESLAKADFGKGRQQVKRTKESVSFQFGKTRKFISEKLDQLFQNTNQQFTLDTLEALFNPDLTATMVINNQQQLLMNNINILQVTQQNEKIQYAFNDKSKHPQQSFKASKCQYNLIRKVIQQGNQKTHDIFIQFWQNVSKK